MKEDDFLRGFAKIVGAEKTLEEIEQKRLKEQRMLAGLSARFGIPVAVQESKEVPPSLIKQQPQYEPDDGSITEEQVEQITENVIPPMPELPAETIITQSVKQLYKTAPGEEQAEVSKIPDLLRRELDALKKTVTDLHSFSRRTSQMGGGGEVNFRYLDDVNRATMTPSNDNWVLEYDAATKKAQFTKDIGPIDTVRFDTAHVIDETEEGTLAWNAADKTLDLIHGGGVVQQIGQEQYYLVKNQTGSTITNGTVCMFSGAESTDGSRLLVTPMVADGTYPSLYIMGIATQDIPTGESGFVTSFGRVGDLDTTGGAENWQLGNILYADPFNNGKMTNVKPTAPNNVIPVAAVVKVDATGGQVFVRVTIEQRMLYARFSDTTDQSPVAIDTPYSITFNTSDVTRGFHVNGGILPTSTITAEESGYYRFNASLSLTSTNSSAKAFYVWMRKNGVDVPNSAKRQSVVGNGTYQVLNYNFTLSLDKDDTVEIMYATSDTSISIEAPAATSFCPAIPSVTLLITQIAL